MGEGNQELTASEADEIRKKAEVRVEQRIGLLYDIAAYVIINAFLVVIWYVTGQGYPWFIWVLAGWGIGLAFHIVSYVTGRKGEASKDRMIQKEMDRIKQEKQ